MSKLKRDRYDLKLGIVWQKMAVGKMPTCMSRSQMSACLLIFLRRIHQKIDRQLSVIHDYKTSFAILSQDLPELRVSVRNNRENFEVDNPASKIVYPVR